MLKASRLADCKAAKKYVKLHEVRSNLLDLLCGVWVVEGRPGLWSYNRGVEKGTLIDTANQVSAEIVRDGRSSATAVFDRETGLEGLLRSVLD